MQERLNVPLNIAKLYNIGLAFLNQRVHQTDFPWFVFIDGI